MRILITLAAGAAGLGAPSLAVAQHTDHHHTPSVPVPPAAPVAPPAAPVSEALPHDHAGHHMPAPGAAPLSHEGHDMSIMRMGDATAAWASGTALMPRAGNMMTGAMFDAGGWALMAHGYVWGSYTDQSGQRGDRMAFVQSMAMLTADRDLTENIHLQLRAMASLEPWMGRRGYPNLLATGETAFGVPLVDRQHPHDMFMELAGRVDVSLGDEQSLFVYGGPVGEPATGPAAFMHRRSARYMPLAPITHHWFDSTHITYGVATLGYRHRAFQVEGSVFTGREPDEARWNIDRLRFDSWSVRATLTPSDRWTLQASHARLKEPEVQHPGEDEARTTASAHYGTPTFNASLAFSAKRRLPGNTLTAWLAEATWTPTRRHAVFGRVENTANDELFPDHADPLHDRRFRVTRIEGGYAHRIPIGDTWEVALGGSVFATALPRVLKPAYGDAGGYTVFAKLSLGQ